MGMLPVAIDARTSVHVKDSVYAPDGWHLWMSIYVDGEYVDGDAGPIVQDVDESALEQAARDWFAARKAEAST